MASTVDPGEALESTCVQYGPTTTKSTNDITCSGNHWFTSVLIQHASVGSGGQRDRSATKYRDAFERRGSAHAHGQPRGVGADDESSWRTKYARDCGQPARRASSIEVTGHH